MCVLSREVTQKMIQEIWLPSRCLAMDGRSDSDIPAFSGMSQYTDKVLQHSCASLISLFLSLQYPFDYSFLLQPMYFFPQMLLIFD
jgi:hypothetical protein